MKVVDGIQKLYSVTILNDGQWLTSEPLITDIYTIYPKMTGQLRF